MKWNLIIFCKFVCNLWQTFPICLQLYCEDWNLVVSFLILFIKWQFNLKTAGGCQFDPPCAFSKNLSSKERVKPWFFVNFNIIISYIFPEYFIEIPHVVQKIWRISLSILANFINFHQFSGILFNNCIKLYSY